MDILGREERAQVSNALVGGREENQGMVASSTYSGVRKTQISDILGCEDVGIFDILGREEDKHLPPCMELRPILPSSTNLSPSRRT